MAITPTIIDKQFKQIWGFDPRTIPTCNLWIDASIGSIKDLSIYGNKVVQVGNVTYATSPNGLKYVIFSIGNYLTMGSASATIVDSVFKIQNITNTYSITPPNYKTFISVSSTQTLPLPAPIAVDALIGTGGMSYYEYRGVLPAYTITTLPTANTSWPVTTITSSKISYTNTDTNITSGAYVFFNNSSSTAVSISLGTMKLDRTFATYSCNVPNPYLIGMYITTSGYTDPDNNGSFPISEFIYDLGTSSRYDITITNYTNGTDPCIFTYIANIISNISNGTQIFLNNAFGSIPSGIYYVTQSTTNTLQITSSQCGNSNIKTGIVNTGASGNSGSMTVFIRILGIRVPITNQSGQVASATTTIARVIPYTYNDIDYTKYILSVDPTLLGYAKDGMSITTSVLSNTNIATSSETSLQTIVDITPNTTIRLINAEYTSANTITYTSAEVLPDYYTNNSYVTISSFNNVSYNISDQQITIVIPPVTNPITPITQFTINVGSDPGLSPKNTGSAQIQNINIIKLSSATYKFGNTFTTYTSTYDLPSFFINSPNVYVTISSFTNTDYNVANAKVTNVDARNFRLSITSAQTDDETPTSAIATIIDPYYVTIPHTGGNMYRQIPLRRAQRFTVATILYLYYYYGAVCATATWSSGFFTYTFDTDITIFGYATGDLITINGFANTAYNIAIAVECTISSDGKTLTIPTTSTGITSPAAGTKGYLEWALPNGGYTSANQTVKIEGFANGNNNTSGYIAIVYTSTFIRRTYSGANETPTTIARAIVQFGKLEQYSPGTGVSKDTGIEFGQGYTVDTVGEGYFTLQSPADSTIPYTMLAQTLPGSSKASSTYVVATSTPIAKTTRIGTITTGTSTTIYVDNIDWIWSGKTNVWFDTRPPTGTYPPLGSKYYVLSANPTITSNSDYAIQVSTTSSGSAIAFTAGTYISNLYLSDVGASYYAATASMGIIQTSPNIAKVTTPTLLDTSLSNMATISGITPYGAIAGSLITGMVQGAGTVTVTLTSNVPSTYVANAVVTINGITGESLNGYNGKFVISSPSGKTFKIASTLLGSSPVYTNSTNSIQPSNTVWAIPTGYNGTYKILSQSVSLPTPLTSYYGFNIASTLGGSAKYTNAKVNVGLDITTNSFAIFAAVKLPPLPITGSEYSYIISKNALTSPHWELYAISNKTNNTITFYISITSTASFTSQCVSTTTSGWVIVSAIANRTIGLCMYINGTSGDTATLSTNTLTSTATTHIGVNSNGQTKPWTSGIGEILMYNTEISSKMQQTIEGYLAWKWGLQNSLLATHPYSGVNTSPPGTKPTSPFSRLLAPTDITNCKIWLDAQDNQSIYFKIDNSMDIYAIDLNSATQIATLYINEAQYYVLQTMGVGPKNTIMMSGTGLSDADGRIFEITSIILVNDGSTITANIICTPRIAIATNSTIGIAAPMLFCYGEFPTYTSVTSVDGWYDKTGQGNTAYPYTSANYNALVPIYSPNYGVVFKLGSRTTKNLQKITNATILETPFSAKNQYETGFIVFNVDYFGQQNTTTYGGTGIALGYFTFLLSSSQYLIPTTDSSIIDLSTNSPYSRTLMLYNHAVDAYADSTASGIFTLRKWGDTSLGRVSTLSLNSSNPGSGELHAGKTYILTYTTVYDSTKQSPYVNGMGCPTLDNGKTFPVSAATSEIRTFIGPQFQGTIMEYIAYTSDDPTTIISDIDQRRVEGYLAKKWGVTLASGHPFATIPADTSVPY